MEFKGKVLEAKSYRGGTEFTLDSLEKFKGKAHEISGPHTKRISIDSSVYHFRKKGALRINNDEYVELGVTLNEDDGLPYVEVNRHLGKVDAIYFLIKNLRIYDKPDGKILHQNW